MGSGSGAKVQVQSSVSNRPGNTKSDEDAATCCRYGGVSGLRPSRSTGLQQRRPPETKATTNANTLALKFKPQLNIKSGCHPFPAVDEEGNTNAGLALYSFKKCGSPTLGSQIYGRAATYEDSYAIMYAWYFPRDRKAAFSHRHAWENIIVWLERKGGTKAKISAVSSSIDDGLYFTIVPPTSDMVDENSVKIQYREKVFSHCVNVTTVAGDFQDLVMWNDLPSAARIALNLYDFGSATVPFNEDTFLDNLKEAYPW